MGEIRKGSWTEVSATWRGCRFPWGQTHLSVPMPGGRQALGGQQELCVLCLGMQAVLMGLCVLDAKPGPADQAEHLKEEGKTPDKGSIWPERQD